MFSFVVSFFVSFYSSGAPTIFFLFFSLFLPIELYCIFEAQSIHQIKKEVISMFWWLSTSKQQMKWTENDKNQISQLNISNCYWHIKLTSHHLTLMKLIDAIVNQLNEMNARATGKTTWAYLNRHSKHRNHYKHRNENIKSIKSQNFKLIFNRFLVSNHFFSRFSVLINPNLIGKIMHWFWFEKLKQTRMIGEIINSGLLKWAKPQHCSVKVLLNSKTIPLE